jgi:hypothetical protein
VSSADVRDIVDRALSDPGFRSELSSDPRAVAERYGYDLTDAEASALASTDWEGSDEQLLARVSKANLMCGGA